jgi:agmatinase
MSDLVRGNVFFCSKDSLEESEFVLIGIPYDCTASFRAGARFAPREIRNYAAEAIEEFSFYFGKSIEETGFYDAGDLPVMCGSPSAMVEAVTKEVSVFLSSGKKVIAIGGEHLVSYPVFLAYRQVYDTITIVHLDAHADLREGYLGDDLSHASVMNLCLKKGCAKLIQYGIRSGSRDEYALRKNDKRIISAETIDDIEGALTAGEKVYLSIDVDFFDPGLFPGTGTPEAGGYAYNDFLAVMKALKKKNIELIGADIVELAPQIDSTGNSTVFAAKLLRDLIIASSDLK